jgi:Fe-S oxidoreductase
VAVDVATYKAEFLAHYYDNKRRPLAHHIFGRIDLWARIASRVPVLANFFTQAPVARHVAHVVAGISPKRNLPGLARESFQRWFGRRDRPQQSADAPRVLLWPDTFNNYFHPETAIAAVEVLEAAGFQVLLPAGHVCCGRPLYDFGMLERAKRLLQQALEILEPEIIAGTPVVVLEPSCASVFRDELLNLFPDNEWAQRLSS